MLMVEGTCSEGHSCLNMAFGRHDGTASAAGPAAEGLEAVPAAGLERQREAVVAVGVEVELARAVAVEVEGAEQGVALAGVGAGSSTGARAAGRTRNRPLKRRFASSSLPGSGTTAATISSRLPSPSRSRLALLVDARLDGLEARRRGGHCLGDPGPQLLGGVAVDLGRRGRRDVDRPSLRLAGTTASPRGPRLGRRSRAWARRSDPGTNSDCAAHDLRGRAAHQPHVGAGRARGRGSRRRRRRCLLASRKQASGERAELAGDEQRAADRRRRGLGLGGRRGCGRRRGSGRRRRRFTAAADEGRDEQRERDGPHGRGTIPCPAAGPRPPRRVAKDGVPDSSRGLARAGRRRLPAAAGRRRQAFEQDERRRRRPLTAEACGDAVLCAQETGRWRMAAGRCIPRHGSATLRAMKIGRRRAAR